MHVIFDLDDTLVHCNTYFDGVIDRFATQLETWWDGAVSREHIKSVQTELDFAGVSIHGFAIEHFPETLVQTQRLLCAQHGRIPEAQHLEYIRALGYEVYQQEFALYPDAYETVSSLHEAGYTLTVYTGGNRDIQLQKMERNGLRPFFADRVFVAQHKNETMLEHILTTLSCEREQTWMIGNSTRSDIVPALQCGIGAIYVPGLTTWAYDARHEPPSIPSPKWLCVRHLRHVIPVLAEQRERHHRSIDEVSA